MKRFIRLTDTSRPHTAEVCLNVSDITMIFNINGEAVIFSKNLKFKPEESYQYIIDELEK